ncbi:major facilitator superfamily domain-containing protein [Penicillium odoratum]|uniref:major facilitator superfamily domain-containing protein n=1 Tax=Penicillium odoratum TaxID=1167516 RepID=UPI0025481397|nr:major facilitator superfamily domain-containing protein [Penicillium odoratum]KAJ5746508.1 major facilitator superfamily domain-containing protein [Penicillium odoratum]
MRQERMSKPQSAISKSTENLGDVLLQDPDTKVIILIPHPSNDPNDPLNWSRAYKFYVAGLSCYVVFLTLFLSGGPAITTVISAEAFFGPNPKLLEKHVAKASYLFTTSALTIGVGNLFWMPLVLKYGRRTIYMVAFTCYLATAIWSAVAKSYTNELIARIFLGFSAGFADCLAPLTISDLFFLHERGSMMVWYTLSNQAGVTFGLVISGLVTMHHSWRVIYHIGIALVGSCLLLIVFTMPETYYVRKRPSDFGSAILKSGDKNPRKGTHDHIEMSLPDTDVPPRKTYSQRHPIFSRSLTKESYLTLFIRPVVLFVLPPVLWTTLVFSVVLGFYVALTSNAPLAFKTVYGFQTYQTGLCFTSSIIGGLIGIAFGGILSDKVANYFTARNGGIREPEMRLPALIITIILGPLSLILYGVGLQEKLHWIVPTLSFGICEHINFAILLCWLTFLGVNFVIVQATTVTLVYAIDSYRPIAGEVIVTQMAFKAAFGFLLFFYTNPWIAKDGFLTSTGAMAGILGAVILGGIPMYIWGKQIRHSTLRWRVMDIVRWNEDRETGE